mmetsp:Transcript_24119/g.91014  ORF Transcript_24119/g.91014 Transcript_24119/m.91014 type:complete len:307 (+) Transcript_24119:1036-1956(+)
MRLSARNKWHSQRRATRPHAAIPGQTMHSGTCNQCAARLSARLRQTTKGVKRQEECCAGPSRAESPPARQGRPASTAAGAAGTVASAGDALPRPPPTVAGARRAGCSGPAQAGQRQLEAAPQHRRLGPGQAQQRAPSGQQRHAHRCTRWRPRELLELPRRRCFPRPSEGACARGGRSRSQAPPAKAAPARRRPSCALRQCAGKSRPLPPPSRRGRRRSPAGALPPRESLPRAADAAPSRRAHWLAPRGTAAPWWPPPFPAPRSATRGLSTLPCSSSGMRPRRPPSRAPRRPHAEPGRTPNRKTCQA